MASTLYLASVESVQSLSDALQKTVAKALHRISAVAGRTISHQHASGSQDPIRLSDHTKRCTLWEWNLAARTFLLTMW